MYHILTPLCHGLETATIQFASTWNQRYYACQFQILMLQILDDSK